MKVTINYINFDLQEGDEVLFEQHYCGKCCCNHQEVTVMRGDNMIAHFGDQLSLDGGDEIFGDVVLDKNGNHEPDHIFSIHIVEKMTEDNTHYLGFCGNIPKKWDRIVFPNFLKFISDKEKGRLCPKCLKAYKKRGEE